MELQGLRRCLMEGSSRQLMPFKPRVSYSRSIESNCIQSTGLDA
jgi:hypothetical protein